MYICVYIQYIYIYSDLGFKYELVGMEYDGVIKNSTTLFCKKRYQIFVYDFSLICSDFVPECDIRKRKIRHVVILTLKTFFIYRCKVLS